MTTTFDDLEQPMTSRRIRQEVAKDLFVQYMTMEDPIEVDAGIEMAWKEATKFVEEEPDFVSQCDAADEAKYPHS